MSRREFNRLPLNEQQLFTVANGRLISELNGYRVYQCEGLVVAEYPWGVYLAFESTDHMGEMVKKSNSNITPLEVYREVAENEEDYETAGLLAGIIKQDRYNRFCEEIIKSDNLLDADRMTFYQLHKEVQVPRDDIMLGLIQTLRSHQQRNDRYLLEEPEQKEIFDVLEKRRTGTPGINRFEYNYLCFLVWFRGYRSPIGMPCYPNIQPIDLGDFITKYATHNRKKLLTIFIRGLLRCAELYDLDQFSVLVGGSFIDLSILSPGDIDLTLLLPLQAYREDMSFKKMNSIIREFRGSDNSNLFDLMTLPAQFGNNQYMAYDQLTLLANRPNTTREDHLVTVSFECRDLYRIEISKNRLSQVIPFD